MEVVIKKTYFYTIFFLNFRSTFITQRPPKRITSMHALCLSFKFMLRNHLVTF